MSFGQVPQDSIYCINNTQLADSNLSRGSRIYLSSVSNVGRLEMSQAGWNCISWAANIPSFPFFGVAVPVPIGKISQLRPALTSSSKEDAEGTG